MRRRAFLTAAASAAIPAIARAQFAGTVLPQSNIGINVPLSGPLEPYGREVIRGAQAAIDEANRYNATLTRAFGLRAFDDQNSGAVATTNVLIAQSDPAIVAMIGNLTADVTLAALSQYANANFALVVPTITADSVTSRGFHNVFRLPTKDSSEGQLLAKVLLDAHPPAVSRAVTVDGQYGVDVARGFVNQMQSRHRDSDVIELPAATFAPSVAVKGVMDAKATYVLLAGKPEKLGPVAEALRLAGYTGEFGLSDSFYTPDVIDKYGKLLAGARVVSAFPPLRRVPSMVQLLADFERQVGSISIFTAYGYAAVQLVIAAAQRHNAITRTSLLTAMQRGESYNLLVGQYAFDYRGDATLPNVYIYRLTKDGFEYEKAAYPSGFVV